MAKTLKELREAAFLTQKEVADLLGVSLSAVSNWERGAKKPTIPNMRRLAEAYHVAPQTISEAVALTVSRPSDGD